MKFNSCWKGLNDPNAFGSASDWIGQWFIQHPSKLSVSDWMGNYMVSEISQPIPKHHILTNTHAFSAIEIHRPCLPNIIPAAFTLNLTSTQSVCKGHAVGAVVHLGIQLMDTANAALLRSWKKIKDTDTLRWAAACSLVYGYISPKTLGDLTCFNLKNLSASSPIK